MKLDKINRLPSEKMMEVAETIARLSYGGHFTIFSFTTNVKFAFGTINSREQIDELIGYDDINDAITNAIQEALVKNNI
jgi:hypothetical protein